MKGDEKNISSLKRHGAILENRKQLTLTGVRDVAGFDEQKVMLTTELGDLTIKGSSLHIDSFSHETGELSLDGSIDSLTYAELKQPEGGFFSRLFK